MAGVGYAKYRHREDQAESRMSNFTRRDSDDNFNNPRYKAKVCNHC